MLLVKIIERKKIMLVLDQFKLSIDYLSPTGLGKIRSGPRMVRAPRSG